MKSFSLASLVLAVLLGVAVAWIRPAQPVQVAQPGAVPAFLAGDGLDNPAVTADPNIHPARKCKYYCYSAAALLLVARQSFALFRLSLTFSCCTSFLFACRRFLHGSK